MAERTDLTTFWEESPRVVEIASPSTDIIIQDLHDTLKSLTLQASENDDSLLNMDDDPLIESEGKADLGGGRATGIVAKFLNAQLAFESRLTPTSSGTITTGDVVGETLIDAAATFITDGVTRNSIVINFTDQSITEVLTIDSEIQLTTRVLRAGTLNQYTIGDVYKVWNVVQCRVSDGDFIAIDEAGDPIRPIFPTAFTQVVIAQSTAPSLINGDAQAFWDALVVDHGVAGSFGALVGGKLLKFATWLALRGGPG